MLKKSCLGLRGRERSNQKNTRYSLKFSKHAKTQCAKTQWKDKLDKLMRAFVLINSAGSFVVDFLTGVNLLTDSLYFIWSSPP